MTEKKPPANVKAIRKGIEIEEKKPAPIPEIVKALESLLEQAKSGNLRELCFTALNEDQTYSVNILGEAIDFTLSYSLLAVLKDNYFEAITYPNLTGFFEGQE